MNETLVMSGSEDPEDHKFIRMKVVTMLTLAAENESKNENDVDEMKSDNVSRR